MNMPISNINRQIQKGEDMKKLVAVIAGFGAVLGFAQAAHAGGNVESLHIAGASGWACTPSSPNWQGNISVIRDDGVVLAVGPANIVREPAVGAVCGGNSAHGFNFSWPLQVNNPAWWDNKNHYIHVYYSNPNGTTFEVPGSLAYKCFGEVIGPQPLC